MMTAHCELFNFFLVCPPGFEDCLERELQKIKESEVIILESFKGGLEIQAKLKNGLELNHKLKTPSKILLRLKSFTARDFPKLFAQTTKIEWRKWLWSNTCDFHITCKQSRLLHSGKVKDSVSKAIEKSLAAQPAKLKTQDFFSFKPQVYFNIVNDLVTVSLDTSYPPLYKRTVSKTIHPASLRENLAYACLSSLLKHQDLPKESITIIDPMCGGATFLTEALEQEPKRSYSYQGFPCYQYKPKYKAHDQSNLSLLKLYGVDIDKNIIQKNQKNYSQLPIEWKIRDLMSDNDDDERLNTYDILICNPPYNKRLKVAMNMKQMIEQMMRVYSPKLMGVIVTNDQISQIVNIHSSYSELEQIKFKNGGIPCSFVIWKRD